LQLTERRRPRLSRGASCGALWFGARKRRASQVRPQAAWVVTGGNAGDGGRSKDFETCGCIVSRGERAQARKSRARRTGSSRVVTRANVPSPARLLPCAGFGSRAGCRVPPPGGAAVVCGRVLRPGASTRGAGGTFDLVTQSPQRRPRSEEEPSFASGDAGEACDVGWCLGDG